MLLKTRFGTPAKGGRGNGKEIENATAYQKEAVAMTISL